MPRGGRRPNSGRPKNTELLTAREVIDRVITQKKWDQLADSLWEQATKGNMRAAELLYHYRFGNPDAELPDPAASKPLRLIEFHCSSCPNPAEQYISYDSALRDSSQDKPQ